MIYKLEIEDRIKKDLLPQKFGVLCTNDKGQPYASLVAFVMSDEIKTILFATDKKTQKYKNMMNEPRVSMLIDTRSNSESDIKDAIAATAIGYAKEINESEKKSFAKLFIDKHPSLKKFINSKTTSLFRIDVKKYLVVRSFQNVEEIHFDK